jgi:hypothetical protein
MQDHGAFGQQRPEFFLKGIQRDRVKPCLVDEADWQSFCPQDAESNERYENRKS